MRFFHGLRGLGGPMAMMGFGLLVAYAGFAADFYKHEIQRSVAEVESIWAPVHLPIFVGMGIAAAGFLWALWRGNRRDVVAVPTRAP